MRKIFFAVMVFGMFAGLMGTVALAAGEQGALEADEMYTTGQVVAVQADRITIRETPPPSTDGPGEVESVYMLTPESRLWNIKSIDDLPVGAEVLVDFVNKDGVQEITGLVLQMSQEEMDAPLYPASED